MTVQIIRDEVTTSGRVVEMAAGNVSMTVVNGSHEVRVIVQNASHRCWRGLGKGFVSLSVARQHYKSESVRAMLDYLLVDGSL